MYDFEFVKPSSIAEATKALSADGAQALSGGQTLLPTMKQRLASPGTLVSLTGYSAMAGALGGGGLGDLGIRYGYQRFLPEVMLAVVVVLVAFVQLLQSVGDWVVRRLSHR